MPVGGTLAARICGLDLDVLLDVTQRGLQLGLHVLARRGAISFTCGGHESFTTLDRAFAARLPTLRVAAKLQTHAGDMCELAHASSQLDLGSIGRSRNELRWKVVSLAVTAVERLAKEEARPREKVGPTSAAPSLGLPPPGALESLRLFGDLV